MTFVCGTGVSCATVNVKQQCEEEEEEEDDEEQQLYKFFFFFPAVINEFLSENL